MMYVFRLLLMVKEIAVEGKINVFRHDRDFLLSIKKGKFEYDKLVQKQKHQRINCLCCITDPVCKRNQI